MGNVYPTSAYVPNDRGGMTQHTNAYVRGSIPHTWADTNVPPEMSQATEERRGVGAGRNDENISRILDGIYDNQQYFQDEFIRALRSVSVWYLNA